MTQDTQLMDLSDEILLEIAARVPFEAPMWSNLSHVNQRFHAIMTTDSLPARANKVQFPIEDALVPPMEDRSVRLSICRKWSEHFSSLAALLSTNRDAQKLIGIAILFLFTSELELDLLPVPSDGSRDDARYQDHDYYLRAQFFYLSILRLLPTDVHAMLRYFTLKVYERGYASDRVLSLLGPEPQGAQQKGQWLIDACGFLNFEMAITMPKFKVLDGMLQCLKSAILNNDFTIFRISRARTRISDNTILPILKTGRILPSAVGVIGTMSVATSSLAWATIEDAESVFPQTAQLEFDDQIARTKELLSQIDAPDGRYVRNMLENLDLKAIRATVIQQKQQALKLAGHELREALAKENEFLTVSRSATLGSRSM